MEFRLVEKKVRVRGREHAYTVLPHPGAVVVAAVQEGKLALVRQFRPAVDVPLWEFPAGTLIPGEDPASCAARELSEETGWKAGHVLPLGGFFPAPGYSSERLHFFLATDLEQGKQALEAGEDIREVAWLPLAALEGMAAGGEIEDAKTLAGLYLLRVHPAARRALRSLPRR